jgi:hypothetical protein
VPHLPVAQISISILITITPLTSMFMGIITKGFLYNL